jgi:hypothetical protein
MDPKITRMTNKKRGLTFYFLQDDFFYNIEITTYWIDSSFID